MAQSDIIQLTDFWFGELGLSYQAEECVDFWFGELGLSYQAEECVSVAESDILLMDFFL